MHYDVFLHPDGRLVRSVEEWQNDREHGAPAVP